jgi:hypothetical protein
MKIHAALRPDEKIRRALQKSHSASVVACLPAPAPLAKALNASAVARSGSNYG